MAGCFLGTFISFILIRDYVDYIICISVHFEGVRAGGESILWKLTKDFSAEDELAALPDSLLSSVSFDEWSFVQIDTDRVEDSVILKEKNLKNVVGLTDIDEKTVCLSAPS